MVDTTQSVSLSGGEEVLVTIPEGATNVEIKLTGSPNLDLALDAGNTEIVDWQNGLISGGSGGSTTYKGTKIEWSGYVGEETLTIDGPVSEDFDLILDAFGSGGDGDVSYSWDNGGQDNGGGNNTNEAPEGTDDTLTATAGEALAISPDTLLANDSDPDGDDLIIIDAGEPENGSLKLEPDSGPVTSLIFTPDQGVDSAEFKYVLSDGDKLDIVDVDLNVQPPKGPIAPPETGPGNGVDETQSVSLSGGEEVLVTIPEGATNVEIKLTGSPNLDLALDAGNTEIVDWQNGLISGGSGGSTTYKGTEIEWSGYVGEETLTIDGPVSEDFDLILDAFGSGGDGDVSYSWDNGGQDNGGGSDGSTPVALDLSTLPINHSKSVSPPSSDLSWEQTLDFLDGEQSWFFDADIGGSGLSPATISVAALGGVASLLTAGTGTGLAISLVGGVASNSGKFDLGGGTDVAINFASPDVQGYQKGFPTLGLTNNIDFYISNEDSFSLGATILPGDEADYVSEFEIAEYINGSPAPKTLTKISIDNPVDDRIPDTTVLEEDFIFSEPGVYAIKAVTDDAGFLTGSNGDTDTLLVGVVDDAIFDGIMV